MYNDDYSFLGRNSAPSETPQSAPVEDTTLTGRARIRVIGVGGAGNNAVNRMIEAGITSAEYIAVNTDAQILACSKAKTRIQIGAHLTKGLGAGADPEIGRNAAEESKEELTKAIENTDLLFIAAGMGGGTGTGAAPVIAKIARDKKILTVAVVTEPFSFEGRRRKENSMVGIENLKKNVDTIIIIPNEKISDVAPKNATMEEALRVADDVLKQGIRGIADLIVTPALINLDFADVRTILKDKGLAHMGVGVAKGENRIVEAVRLAVNCPLLETTIEGATGIIVNIVGGPDLTYDEVRFAGDLIYGVVDYSANIIFGACIDPNISDEVEVTVIATGFPSAEKIMQDSTRGAAPSFPQSGAVRPAYSAGSAYDRNAGATVPRANYGAAQQQPVRPTPDLSRQPGYGAPVPPQPGYGAPVQPQPGYGAPAQPQQGYGAPVPPQPAYAPAQPQQSYGAPESPAYEPAPQPTTASAPAETEEEDYAANPRDQKLPPFVQRLLGKKKNK